MNKNQNKKSAKQTDAEKLEVLKAAFGGTDKAADKAANAPAIRPANLTLAQIIADGFIQSETVDVVKDNVKTGTKTVYKHRPLKSDNFDRRADYLAYSDAVNALGYRLFNVKTSGADNAQAIVALEACATSIVSICKEHLGMDTVNFKQKEVRWLADRACRFTHSGAGRWNNDFSASFRRWFEYLVFCHINLIDVSKPFESEATQRRLAKIAERKAKATTQPIKGGESKAAPATIPAATVTSDKARAAEAAAKKRRSDAAKKAAETRKRNKAAKEAADKAADK